MSEVINKQSIIPPELAGARFDQAVAKLFPEYSRNLLKSWILTAEITLDSQQEKPRTKVQPGQLIAINAHPAQQANNPAQAIDLDIIYENDALLVINKPANLVVHPGAGNQDNTLLNALLHHADSLRQLPRAGIVHRLDKDTTGLMVVAKTLESHHFLINAMQERHITREYQAIVCGEFISGGTIDEPIGRHPNKRTHMAVTPQGKPAQTHYRIMEKMPHHTHLRVILETGRTHQIRVHMAHVRHPLVGDKTYGGRLRLPKGASAIVTDCLQQFPRQALHAWRLTLPDPGTNEPKVFEAPLPQDMQNLLKILRQDTCND